MSRQDLMSAVINNLNLGGALRNVRDLRAKAIGQQLIFNRDTYARPLPATTLKYWHELLLGYENRLQIIGDYRQGRLPMRIISGPDYRQEIHFEAPPADRVATEMEPFIAYCNASNPQTVPGITRAGIAHVWFESVHPFEDGKGRLGSAIMEKMVSQSLVLQDRNKLHLDLPSRRCTSQPKIHRSYTGLRVGHRKT